MLSPETLPIRSMLQEHLGLLPTTHLLHWKRLCEALGLLGDLSGVSASKHSSSSMFYSGFSLTTSLNDALKKQLRLGRCLIAAEVQHFQRR